MEKTKWLSMENGTNFMREKAYKLLMEQYRSLYNTIWHRASNSLEYGQKEDHTKFLGTIVDKSKYDYTGIWHKENQKLVETLEYLLDDSKPVK